MNFAAATATPDLSAFQPVRSGAEEQGLMPGDAGPIGQEGPVDVVQLAQDAGSGNRVRDSASFKTGSPPFGFAGLAESRDSAQPLQVVDKKADNGNTVPEMATQEEYERIRDESRFEMTTRNDIAITGASPSFNRIPGEGISSVFHSGFIIRRPDGRYLRFPPGFIVEQYLNGRVIIKDPSGRVHTEYRSS